MKKSILRSKLLFPVILLVLLAGNNVTSALNQAIPVELKVPVAPLPVEANGEMHLVYELHITNFYPRAMFLHRIDIFGYERSTKPLKSYQDSDLVALLDRPGQPELPDKRSIGGGMRAIIFLWLALKSGDPIPESIHHRLFFKFTNAVGKDDEDIVEGAQIKVYRYLPIAIDAPLRGGDWVAANGPSNNSIHRRRFLAFNGRVTISQRFAYDFMKLGEDGKAVSGDPSINKNWHGYGAEVLAVADGIVADVQDGDPENIPLSSHRVLSTQPRIFQGNYVVVDIGNGYFAFYAHFQPNTIRVKIGNKVKRGQIIGLLGNSGNSDAPHLHFHISDGKSPVESEGLPFVFRSFDVLGEAKLSVVLGLEPATESWRTRLGVVPSKQQGKMTLENAVIRFP